VWQAEEALARQGYKTMTAQSPVQSAAWVLNNHSEEDWDNTDGAVMHAE
jgi:hypothetical protein